MTDQLEVSVTLANEKVQFTGVAQSNPAITIDYVPPLGDGQGYMPLELLLISLAACSGSTVATLLRRAGQSVAGLEVRAAGVRRQAHPTSFERILLEFRLTSADATAADVEQAIRISEETVCPVWAMLKNNVEIGWEYRISAG